MAQVGADLVSPFANKLPGPLLAGTEGLLLSYKGDGRTYTVQLTTGGWLGGWGGEGRVGRGRWGGQRCACRREYVVRDVRGARLRGCMQKGRGGVRVGWAGGGGTALRGGGWGREGWASSGEGFLQPRLPPGPCRHPMPPLCASFMHTCLPSSSCFCCCCFSAQRIVLQQQHQTAAHPEPPLPLCRPTLQLPATPTPPSSRRLRATRTRGCPSTPSSPRPARRGWTQVGPRAGAGGAPTSQHSAPRVWGGVGAWQWPGSRRPLQLLWPRLLLNHTQPCHSIPSLWPPSHRLPGAVKHMSIRYDATRASQLVLQEDPQQATPFDQSAHTFRWGGGRGRRGRTGRRWLCMRHADAGRCAARVQCLAWIILGRQPPLRRMELSGRPGHLAIMRRVTYQVTRLLSSSLFLDLTTAPFCPALQARGGLGQGAARGGGDRLCVGLLRRPAARWGGGAWGNNRAGAWGCLGCAGICQKMRH